MKQITIGVALAALNLMTRGAVAHEDHHKTVGAGHAAAIGRPGDASKVSRTIEVDMNDMMRFVPQRVDVKRGETVRFVVHNGGKVKHEMVLGSPKELQAHAALMRKFPEMEHADPNQVAVEPGKTGELVWQFTKAGKLGFACLQPGHFEAGMVGKVAVR